MGKYLPFQDLKDKAVDGVVHRPSTRQQTKNYKCCRCDKIKEKWFFAGVALIRRPTGDEPYRSFGVCWVCTTLEERHEAERLPSTSIARS